MKFAASVAEASATVLAPREPIRGGTWPADERTRDAVLRLIHESRAVTAAVLAEQLNLSPAGIRRHLDTLVADGLVCEVELRPVSAAARGRGRPAKSYTLTDAGRAGFGHAYDDLASTALRYLRKTGGDAAVEAFAEDRADSLGAKLRARLSAAEGSNASRVDLVAAALSDEGYAAKVMPAGGGTQICQHHCPVAHVAAEFPELCAAETRLLAEVLGTYVQRLATIAHGDGVCTTHVPGSDPPRSPSSVARPHRSPSQLSLPGGTR